MSRSRGTFPLVAVLGVGALAASAAAQEPDRRFGMDEAAFRALFAKDAARTDDRPAQTVEEVADQATDVRLFLAADNKTVVGEVAVAGRTKLQKITLQLDEGPVVFADSGQAPDRKAGDGVFTARLARTAEATWASMRRELQAVKDVQAAGPRFVRRGPRDLVPLAQFMETTKRTSPALFQAIVEGSKKAAAAGQARTLQEAARLTGVDLARTPFLVVPVERPRRIDEARLGIRRLFDIPLPDFFPPPLPPVPVDDERSLMVVHPGVVDDPARTFDGCTGAGTEGGPWSFGHLMRELSHGTGMTPEDYTMHWLSTWIVAQEANGFIVNEPGRAAQLQSRVIASWQQLSGATLDVDRFPARLLAIVNRPDLADRIGYGVAGSAGEGRFVFGLLQKNGATCTSLPFTVIFEYGIRGGTCSAVKAWHQRWKDLDANAPGSAAYNAALETITRDFSDHGSNPAQLPNQSSLNQLRTNENALASTWQLREFRLQSSGSVPPGLLDLVTVKQTPDDGFRNGTVGTATVASYLQSAEADILANRHVVPERFPGIFDPFMGAKSDVPFPPSQVFWNAPGLAAPPMTDPAEARRKFSLSTCNACHGGETATFFTHIGNVGGRNPGSPAALSGFLTGIDVTLPVPGTWPRHYDDLAEREAAMSRILTSSCVGLLGVRRLPFVH